MVYGTLPLVWGALHFLYTPLRQERGIVRPGRVFCPPTNRRLPRRAPPSAAPDNKHNLYYSELIFMIFSVCLRWFSYKISQTDERCQKYLKCTVNYKFSLKKPNSPTTIHAIKYLVEVGLLSYRVVQSKKNFYNLIGFTEGICGFIQKCLLTNS